MDDRLQQNDDEKFALAQVAPAQVCYMCFLIIFCMDFTRGKTVPLVLRPRQVSSPGQVLAMRASVEHVTLNMENYMTRGKEFTRVKDEG